MNGAAATILLGAYERDNFGDVLFLHVTREALGEIPTAIGAPFGSPGNFHPIGLDVHSLRDLSQGPSSPSIWMVGGEIGGTSAAAAYEMAVDEQEFQAFHALRPGARRRFLYDLTGRSPYASPYLPRMSGTRDTWGSRLIVNSAGLSGLDGLVGHRADEGWQAIKEASYVSVRDRASSDVLSRRRVEHTLAPDLVHALRLRSPGWSQRPKRERPLALLHVKGSVLSAFGPEELASVIARSRSLRGFEIRLFVAGTARGHDSIELYRETMAHLSRMAPDAVVSLAEGGDAIEKARLIAQADLWIGTSLHGLIISSAFDVPRVALALDKLTRYARTWDDPMPVGVQLDDLDAAVDSALTTQEVPDRSSDLAEAAWASAMTGREVLAKAVPDSGIASLRAQTSARLERRAASPLRFLATETAATLRAWRHG